MKEMYNYQKKSNWVTFYSHQTCFCQSMHTVYMISRILQTVTLSSAVESIISVSAHLVCFIIIKYHGSFIPFFSTQYSSPLFLLGTRPLFFYSVLVPFVSTQYSSPLFLLGTRLLFFYSILVPFVSTRYSSSLFLLGTRPLCFYLVLVPFVSTQFSFPLFLLSYPKLIADMTSWPAFPSNKYTNKCSSFIYM